MRGFIFATLHYGSGLIILLFSASGRGPRPAPGAGPRAPTGRPVGRQRNSVVVFRSAVCGSDSEADGRRLHSHPSAGLPASLSRPDPAANRPGTGQGQCGSGSSGGRQVFGVVVESRADWAAAERAAGLAPLVHQLGPQIGGVAQLHQLHLREQDFGRQKELLCGSQVMAPYGTLIG